MIKQQLYLYLFCALKKNNLFNDKNLLSDSAINVGDDNLVGVVPQVDVGHAACGTLVLRGHGEHHLIVALAQVEPRL